MCIFRVKRWRVRRPYWRDPKQPESGSIRQSGFTFLLYGPVPNRRQSQWPIGQNGNPSGAVVVWDNFKGPGRLVNAAFDFFGMAYLVGTGAQTYTAEEVSGWLTQNGFDNIRRYRTDPGLIKAVRQ
jgi:hypothetical protein